MRPRIWPRRRLESQQHNVRGTEPATAAPAGVTEAEGTWEKEEGDKAKDSDDDSENSDDFDPDAWHLLVAEGRHVIVSLSSRSLFSFVRPFVSNCVFSKPYKFGLLSLMSRNNGMRHA